MKKSIIVPLSLAIALSMPLVVNAYFSEDVLYTKNKIFGMNSLECDVNDDGSTNVLDFIQIKHDMLKDAENISSNTNKVYVSNIDELKSALSNAQAGDEIILKSGIYEDTSSKWTPFTSSGEGTEDNPIIIRSENPKDKAHIKCTDTSSSIALQITGDYWIIQDLEVSTAQKGIVLDNSNYSIISNCDVHNIGSEGVHFRDNSSYCTIKDSYIYDTGVVSSEYGEGVYVGSSQWTSGYGYSCDYNTIQHCTFNNIGAEHIDIKEFTTGTIIEDCTMHGSGMIGKNYADSFIDIQGNGCIIRNNTCYQDNNSIIVDAFQVHVLADGWGFDNQVYDNICYFDDTTSYILRGWDCGCTAKNNIRYPEGNTYDDDSITILD